MILMAGNAGSRGKEEEKKKRKRKKFHDHAYKKPLRNQYERI